MAIRSVLITSKYWKSAQTCSIAFRKMSTSSDDVLFEEVKDKGIITLNRPKALNALDLSMVNKLLPKLKKWESEKKLVLIKGAGEKAFCAGGDVRAVTEDGLKGGKYGHEFFKMEYTTNGVIGTYSIPYIAFIDGIVMGGGVGLSVHGPYRIATEKTLFAMPETAIGLFPDVGGSYFLPRLGGKLGLYLALTGVRLKGSDVLKAGIATHLVNSGSLPEIQEKLMDCNNEQDINNVLGKFCVKADAPFTLQPYLEQINKCFNENKLESVIKNLEADGSEWAKSTLALLNKMCPLSLKITMLQLEKGAKLNLMECLQMEYRLAIHCLENKNFYEGVSALLIRKDQSPKWNPATISEVSDALVESHFAKLPEEDELKHKL